MDKLILVGDSAFAEVAHEYFSRQSPYTVIAFAVEKAFRKRDSLLNLPLVDLEDIEERYSPLTHAFHAAIAYNTFNTVRERLIGKMLGKGYRSASFVSPHACVSESAHLGKHCFIFENNVIQPFVSIGDNCVLWSGNHIGHHSTIGNNCFISSHVVLSGSSRVGDYTFIGVNACIADNVSVGPYCIVGAGSVVSRDIPEDTVIRPLACKQSKGAKRYMGIRDELA